MKVTDLQAYLLSSPLPEPHRVRTAAGELSVHKQDCLLLRIHTDQQLIGYSAGPASANLAQLLNRNLKSAVVNIDPVRIDGLKKKVFQRRPQFPGLVQAFGLVEIALLDLCGKMEGCPVSELLGGRTRQRVPLVASAGFYLGAEAAAQEGLALVEQGFTSYKLRAGLGPETDAEVIRSVRQALPEAYSILVDAQAWWQMGNEAYPAERLDPWLAGMAGHSALKLAEPFPSQSIEAYRQLIKKGIIQVIAGEHESEPQRLLALEETGVDGLQVNPMLLGGITSALELHRNLERPARRLFCGASSPLEVLMMAHLASLLPEALLEGVEFPCYSGGQKAGMYPFALGDHLLREALPIERGEFVVPTAPGLGIEVNEAAIQRYPWKSGPARILR